MFHRKLAFCSALLAAALAPARAGIIFDNIGPGFPGDSNTGYGNVKSYFGTPFLAAGSGPLLQVIDDAFNETNPGVVTAGLYTDSGGEPGTLLESWSFTEPGSDTVSTLTSVLHPVLTAGKQYWLVYGPGAVNLQWSGNDTGVNADPWTGTTLTGLSGGGTDSAQLGLELINSTPEPATGPLVASALAALLGLAAALRWLRA